jgi:glycosyltransferase involved in cell wall biosynthesis
MARNDWFQHHALSALRKLRERDPGTTYTLFSYSYAALRLFAFAKDAGWSTVLGQIDPGPFEESIVIDLHRKAGRENDANPAPPIYWERWREECRLADRIVVNSNWSRHGLLTEGVTAEKIQVVPLAYDPPNGVAEFAREYPAAFDFKRPLRVLFLGQVSIRKGMMEILGAISRLEKLPVEFWIVGHVQIPVPPEYERHPRVKWFGSVSRGEAARFYREADVFLFPTFSDGFGLTQLEAQAWNLPVIASRRCGDVVEHGVNGCLLSDVSAEAIVRAIQRILAEPAALTELSAHSRKNEFTLDKLRGRLDRLGQETIVCCNC